MKRQGPKSWAWMVVIACIWSLVLLGCASDTDPTTPPDETGDDPVQGGIFQEAKLGDATYINPVLTAESVGGTLVEYIFESLISVDAQSQVIPLLAHDYQVSEDQLTWTFQLREDVTWHDGEPFSARDVKFTFDSILHPYYTGPLRGSFSGLKGVQELDGELTGISAKMQGEEIDDEQAQALMMAAYEDWLQRGAVQTPDPYTVVLQLDEPFAPFLLYCGGVGILPEHLLGDSQGAAMEEHPFNREPVGTGRFRFKEWQSGEYIALVRNDDWWGDPRPYVDEVLIKIIPDWNVLEIALETGELDLGAVQHENAGRIEKEEHLSLYEYPRFTYTFMGLNMTNPLFQDKAVRQAMAYAIDQQAMVDEIFAGRGTVASTHASPARWDYNPDVKTYPHDPDKAKELLRQAGWERMDDGSWERDGQTLAFTLYTHQQQQREAAVVVIQEDLNRIGIEVEVQILDWPTFVGQVLIGRQFDAAVVAWNLGPDPDAYSIWHTHGGMYNFIGYSDERVDRILEQARVVLDQQTRLALYQELQEILAEEQPYVFLFYPNGLEALNQRMNIVDAEFEPSPAHNGNMTWNLHHWWIPAENQQGPMLSPN